MNGHSMCPIFEQSNLPGVMTVYADALHEGPVPADLPEEQMREVRARYISGPTGSWEQVAASLRAWDAPLGLGGRFGRRAGVGRVRLRRFTHGAPAAGATYRNESLRTIAPTMSSTAVLRVKCVINQSM